MTTINLDWFSPFDSSTTKHNSVGGGIYLTLDSLPRNIRYLPGNIIFLGCIPGPSEPKTTEINNYLKVIVDELLPLYRGVDMETYNSKGEKVKVRLALLKIAADSPAQRKVIGFLSYNSSWLISTSCRQRSINMKLQAQNSYLYTKGWKVKKCL
ncbi:hypothetical protein K501DRAFT_257340 [Backusella circina FSU 941]|nr:hypothetical protein K501DRAFT_257340 [Backusella circina FSU 941]